MSATAARTLLLSCQVRTPIAGKVHFGFSQILDDDNALGTGGKHVVHLKEYNLQILVRESFCEKALVLTPKLYISALLWLRGPLLLDNTSGAMYNFVPTSGEKRGFSDKQKTKET